MTRLNSQKGFVVPLVIVVIVILVGGGIYLARKNKSVPENTNSTTTAISKSDLKPYRNDSLGFEMEIPSDAVITIERNDSRNKLVSFIYEKDKSFIVDLKKIGTNEKLENYVFMDARSNENTMIASQVGAVFKTSTYPPDGRGDVLQALVLIVTDHNGYFYRLGLFGDTEISTVEKSIIDSFKFIK